MKDYLNSTSLKFMVVFVVIIIISLSLFEVLSYLEENNSGVEVSPAGPDNTEQNIVE
ncbi:MAG: hypothetical protein U5L75_02535 [Candidatus Campbellbacteria bacterium]|nr:hypothetical protein [Candidatus Campbellbacteria bacterium]